MTKLLLDAHAEYAEEKLYQQWLVDYARMDSTNMLSFEQYKNNFKPVRKNKDVKYDKEKILADAELIKNAHQKVKTTEQEV